MFSKEFDFSYLYKFETVHYPGDVQNIWQNADATNDKNRKFQFSIRYVVNSGEMKYNDEVDDVGAVEGGHVEHEDDLDPLDVGHGQEVGQRPHQAPQQKEGRDENRQKLTASYEHIIYLGFNLRGDILQILTAMLDR